MKLGKLLFMGVLSGLVFTACVNNDDKSEWNDGSQPVSFTSSIKGVKTRAVDTKWTAGDKVGIFMKAAGGELAAATGVNKLHTTDANGNLTASNAESALYYPTDGSSVDFIAYYPYSTSLAGTTYKVDVVSQIDQPAIDLLYSNNAKGFAKGAATKPQLQFTHMLSQIVFNIEKDNTIPTLNGLKVTFKGMNTKADFALADGTLSNAGTPTDIVAAVNESTVKTIALPAASLSGIKVVFDLNGKTYTTDYPQAILEAGHKYTHRVKLSDSNGQPVIEMDPAGITDWTEVPGDDIEVDFGGGGVTPPAEGVEVTTDKPYSETFAEGQGEFTINNVLEPAAGVSVWTFAQSYSCMKASGFSNGNQNSEGWLISPSLKIATAKSATLTFQHAAFIANGGAFADADNFTLHIRESGQNEWTNLTIPVYPSASWAFISSGDIDLTSYMGKSIQIGFKYVSTTSNAGTWEIKNLKLILSNEEEEKPTPGETVTLFDETIGTPSKVNDKWPYADQYTGWTDTHNLTYTSYNVSARLVDNIANLWFPKSKECNFQVSVFNTVDYTDLKFTFDIACAQTGGNQNEIIVETDKGKVTVPSVATEVSPNYHSVELTLQSGMTWIKLTAPNLTKDYRIGKMKLVGTAK